MPFRNAKTLKIELADYGSYLGRGEGCFELRNKDGTKERYPHFQKEIGECVLKAGSYVSTDALIDLALWNIDTYIMTRKNRVVAVLKNLEDDSHVKTRVAQYQALTNEKGIAVAKQIIEFLKVIQQKFGLSNIYILSDKVGSYRAWCFSQVDFSTYILILAESLPIIDYNFFYWTVFLGKATLRISPKYDRPAVQKIVAVLESYYVPFPSDQIKISIYDTGLEKLGTYINVPPKKEMLR
jgi:hypothetical protein